MVDIIYILRNVNVCKSGTSTKNLFLTYINVFTFAVDNSSTLVTRGGIKPYDWCEAPSNQNGDMLLRISKVTFTDTQD